MFFIRCNRDAWSSEISKRCEIGMLLILRLACLQHEILLAAFQHGGSLVFELKQGFGNGFFECAAKHGRGWFELDDSFYFKESIDLHVVTLFGKSIRDTHFIVSSEFHQIILIDNLTLLRYFFDCQCVSAADPTAVIAFVRIIRRFWTATTASTSATAATTFLLITILMVIHSTLIIFHSIAVG